MKVFVVLYDTMRRSVYEVSMKLLYHFVYSNSFYMHTSWPTRLLTLCSIYELVDYPLMLIKSCMYIIIFITYSDIHMKCTYPWFSSNSWAVIKRQWPKIIVFNFHVQFLWTNWKRWHESQSWFHFDLTALSLVLSLNLIWCLCAKFLRPLVLFAISHCLCI